MTAVAHFYCRPNSHQFQERHVFLNEPTKIGRSVARCRPSPSNAVFDCKVLSRNHALLWFENGKFYLQDTKSSNGTFVNNQRLSKASEESAAVEVNSCDIVQFGVDVVDNARKVTHGCIVSQLRLYLPNGEESKQSNCTWNNQLMEKVPFSNSYPTVQTQDLYQLHQYLQEALHREQMLEQKLALLQRLVLNSQDASEKGWQALIDEDRLLSRLEFLENQLQAYNKTQTEDSLQCQLQQVQEEKYNYENTSKETLRQALQEKLEAVQRCTNLERSLSNIEDECTHLRNMNEQVQNELSTIVVSHQAKLQELTEKLQDSERIRAESKNEWENQKEELQIRLDVMKTEEERLREALMDVEDKNLDETNKTEDDTKGADNLVDWIDRLETTLADPQQLTKLLNSDRVNEITKSRLLYLLDLPDEVTKTKVIETNNCINEVQGDAEVRVIDDLLLKSSDDIKDGDEEDISSDDLRRHLSTARDKLLHQSSSLRDFKEKVLIMEERLRCADAEKSAEEERRKKLEEELMLFKEEKEKQTASLTETSRELQAALNDRESLMEREEHLRLMVEESERMIQLCQGDSVAEEEDDNQPITSTSLAIFRAKWKELQNKLKEANSKLEVVQQENDKLKNQMESRSSDNTEDSCETSEHLTDEIKAELDCMKERLEQQEEHIKKLQDELESSEKTAATVPLLQAELDSSKSLMHDRENECTLLQAQLSRAEQTVQEVKAEILSLQEKLLEEQDSASKHSRESEELRESCNKQALFIERLQKREQDALDKLCAALDQLAEKEDQVSKLKEENRDILKEKESISTQFDAIKGSLIVAEREKQAISLELKKLELKRKENEQSLKEQIETNQSLQEIVEDEKKKWEATIGSKDEELAEVTSRCQQLIQDREASNRADEASPLRRLLVTSMLVGIMAYFFFFVFADPAPLHPY